MYGQNADVTVLLPFLASSQELNTLPIETSQPFEDLSLQGGDLFPWWFLLAHIFWARNIRG